MTVYQNSPNLVLFYGQVFFKINSLPLSLYFLSPSLPLSLHNAQTNIHEARPRDQSEKKKKKTLCYSPHSLIPQASISNIYFFSLFQPPPPKKENKQTNKKKNLMQTGPSKHSPGRLPHQFIRHSLDIIESLLRLM